MVINHGLLENTASIDDFIRYKPPFTEDFPIVQ